MPPSLGGVNRGSRSARAVSAIQALVACTKVTSNWISNKQGARKRDDERAAFSAIVKARLLIIRLKKKNVQMLLLPHQELAVNATLMVPPVSVVWVGNLCALPLAR